MQRAGGAGRRRAGTRKRLGRPLPGRSRRALRPAHERRGAQARPARHGLPHAARARRARRPLLGARRARAGAPRHGLADLQRPRGPAHRLDPRAPPADEQHAARAPMRASTASRRATPTRPAGTSRRAPIAAACGSTRSCSARPTRRGRDRDIARLLDWGFDRYKRARLVRAGQPFGRAGTVRVVAAKGLSATLDPGEQVQRARRAAAPPRTQRCARASALGYVELRSARGVIGRVSLVGRPRRRRATRRSCHGCAPHRRELWPVRRRRGWREEG